VASNQIGGSPASQIGASPAPQLEPNQVEGSPTSQIGASPAPQLEPNKWKGRLEHQTTGLFTLDNRRDQLVVNFVKKFGCALMNL
jgi:hypothetical protein